MKHSCSRVYASMPLNLKRWYTLAIDVTIAHSLVVLRILFYYWSAQSRFICLSLKCACTRESIFWCRSTAGLIDFVPPDPAFLWQFLRTLWYILSSPRGAFPCLFTFCWCSGSTKKTHACDLQLCTPWKGFRWGLRIYFKERKLF